MLSAGTAGLDQWASDSAKHPNMSGGEKLARAGNKAAWSGGLAAAGAKGGAAVGAAFGSLAGPVGTVVGGVVGGIAGGIAGSELGGKIADGLNSWFSDED